MKFVCVSGYALLDQCEPLQQSTILISNDVQSNVPAIGYIWYVQLL